MIKDTQTWEPHQNLLESTQELRFKINHAYYGKIPTFTGNDLRNENRFYFCTDNCGKVSWMTACGEKKEILLGAGTLTFMPGNLDITYDFTSGRMAAFHFNLEIFPGLDIFAGENTCLQKSKEKTICNKVITVMKKGGDLHHVMHINSLLFQAASYFCKGKIEDLQCQIKLRHKYAELLAIVEEYLDLTLSVGELATMLGLTRDQLSKSFRRDLGISLKSYLNTRLTRKASQLLTTGMNVRETAKELCFSSEFYFSRFFRTQTGYTPSAYRKRFSP